jgi:hypothetical protein
MLYLYKIKNLEIKLGGLTSEIEDNTTRSDAMSIHMKNVKQELTHTQVFYTNDSRGFMMPSVDKSKLKIILNNWQIVNVEDSPLKLSA